MSPFRRRLMMQQEEKHPYITTYNFSNLDKLLSEYHWQYVAVNAKLQLQSNTGRCCYPDILGLKPNTTYKYVKMGNISFNAHLRLADENKLFTRTLNLYNGFQFTTSETECTGGFFYASSKDYMSNFFNLGNTLWFEEV